MPALTPEALQALQQGFRDAAFLSNRLSEWIELEPLLRNLDTSFRLFYAETKASGFPAKIPPKRLVNMHELWDRCHGTDFQELQSFALRAPCISRALAAGADGNGSPSAPFVAWVTALEQLDSQIQNALTNGNFQDVKQFSDQFRTALDRMLTDRRSVLMREACELCNLTILLKQQLDA